MKRCRLSKEERQQKQQQLEAASGSREWVCPGLHRVTLGNIDQAPSWKLIPITYNQGYKITTPTVLTTPIQPVVSLSLCLVTPPPPLLNPLTCTCSPYHHPIHRLCSARQRQCQLCRSMIQSLLSCPEDFLKMALLRATKISLGTSFFLSITLLAYYVLGHRWLNLTHSIPWPTMATPRVFTQQGRKIVGLAAARPLAPYILIVAGINMQDSHIF